jgi:hypothetical protein
MQVVAQESFSAVDGSGRGYGGLLPPDVAALLASGAPVLDAPPVGFDVANACSCLSRCVTCFVFVCLLVFCWCFGGECVFFGGGAGQTNKQNTHARTYTHKPHARAHTHTHTHTYIHTHTHAYSTSLSRFPPEARLLMVNDPRFRQLELVIRLLLQDPATKWLPAGAFCGCFWGVCRLVSSCCWWWWWWWGTGVVLLVMIGRWVSVCVYWPPAGELCHCCYHLFVGVSCLLCMLPPSCLI